MEKVRKTDEEWRRDLTPRQYWVTRRKGTEPPFTGDYHGAGEEGTYLCVCCGQVLFRAEHQYDSGTGWPSFWRPAEPGSVALASEESCGLRRTEVLCPRCDAHLGHLFEDGPPPTGERYCINSAALRFVRSR